MSFLLFCYRMRVYKSKRVPLLHFSALCDIFRKIFFSKISSFFPKKNVLRFLSLRYSADLRRSRLVSTSSRIVNLRPAEEQQKEWYFYTYRCPPQQNILNQSKNPNTASLFIPNIGFGNKKHLARPIVCLFFISQVIQIWFLKCCFKVD